MQEQPKPGQHRYTYFVSDYAHSEQDAMDRLESGPLAEVDADVTGIFTLVATTDPKLAAERKAELRRDAERRGRMDA